MGTVYKAKHLSFFTTSTLSKLKRVTAELLNVLFLGCGVDFFLFFFLNEQVYYLITINLIESIHSRSSSKKLILTKRLELLLRTVLALPKASNRGFDCRMISFTCCHTHAHKH